MLNRCAKFEKDLQKETVSLTSKVFQERKQKTFKSFVNMASEEV